MLFGSDSFPKGNLDAKRIAETVERIISELGYSDEVIQKIACKNIEKYLE